MKFLDPDKPTWQRSLALEVLHKMTIQPELLNSFCKCYDLNKHTTSIFQDIVNSLGAYVQSLFVNPQLQINNTSTLRFRSWFLLIYVIFSEHNSRTTACFSGGFTGRSRGFTPARFSFARCLATHCRDIPNRSNKINLVSYILMKQAF